GGGSSTRQERRSTPSCSGTTYRTVVHMDVLGDDVHVELRPHGGSQAGDDGYAYAVGAVGDGSRPPCLEAEPVSEVLCGCFAQVALGRFTAGVLVDVDVDGAPHYQFPGQKRGRSFVDPAIVDE